VGDAPLCRSERRAAGKRTKRGLPVKVDEAMLHKGAFARREASGAAKCLWVEKKAASGELAAFCY